MEYPLNCYIGVCSDDSNVLLDLAEQEKWEELVVALETNPRLVNKSRNIQRPVKNKGGDEGVFNCLSLKYLGKIYFPNLHTSMFPHTQGVLLPCRLVHKFLSQHFILNI